MSQEIWNAILHDTKIGMAVFAAMAVVGWYIAKWAYITRLPILARIPAWVALTLSMLTFAHTAFAGVMIAFLRPAAWVLVMPEDVSEFFFSLFLDGLGSSMMMEVGVAVRLVYSLYRGVRSLVSKKT